MSSIAITGGATGTGVFSLLAPSTSTNRTLTLPDSTGTLALAGAAVARSQMPSGSVLQVVYAHTGAAFTLTTTTPVEIIAATITPTSATSKILLLVTAASVGKSASAAEGWFGVYKNGSALLNPYDGIATYTAGTMTIGIGSVSCEYLDNPGTTNALTYSLRAKDDQSSGLRINWEGGVSSVTLLEIAA